MYQQGRLTHSASFSPQKLSGGCSGKREREAGATHYTTALGASHWPIFTSHHNWYLREVNLHYSGNRAHREL